MALAIITTPEELKAALTANFSPEATSWRDATTEIRDMSRWARKALALGDEHAANFRGCDTPAQWNALGIESIVNFYIQMGAKTRVSYIAQISVAFPNLF